MAKPLSITTWNPLDYFSPEELARLDERFDYALRGCNLPGVLDWLVP